MVNSIVHLLALVFLAGCAAPSTRDADIPVDAGGFESTTSDGDPGDSTSTDACNGPIYVLTYFQLDKGMTLRRFDPMTLTFTTIGLLKCLADLSPFGFNRGGMAIDRDGIAWVTSASSSNVVELSKIRVSDASCVSTVPFSLQGFMPFSTPPPLAFASDGPNNNTLYTLDVNELIKIDQKSLGATFIGALQNNSGSLVGTGDGRLYTTYSNSIFQLDTGDASTKSTYSAAFHSSVSRLAFWGGDLWLFETVYPDDGSPSLDALVERFDLQSKSLTVALPHLDFLVYSASSSTCAPLTKPN